MASPNSKDPQPLIHNSQPSLKRAREDDDDHTSRPKATNSNNNASVPTPKRPREDDTTTSRPRKRPGGASRIAPSQVTRVQERQRDREAQATSHFQSSRGNEEVVRQHYNAVPQRGREWRKTDSKIKGLRSFNNWVKSVVIGKFAPEEENARRDGEEPAPLNVLDLGCGKGGDLGKWAQATQPVQSYVGIDPAEVSIEQARERYAQMRGGGGARGGRGGYHGGGRKRGFDAAFIVDDAFANSLGDLPIIREIGFGPGSRWGPSGGFDVVSMMFCMHYAFESEAKAKGMLANVASSLKKGGRFIGVIPNSDALEKGVVEWHKKKAEKSEANDEEERKDRQEADGNGDNAPEKEPPDDPTEASKALDVITEPAPDAPAPQSTEVNGINDSASPSSHPARDSKAEDAAITTTSPQESSTPEWGNPIYRVHFNSHPASDGLFRGIYGWKYSYFMEEAVDAVPEYVVPWEAFRHIAEDYNLELQWRRTFHQIWEDEGYSRAFGPLSERMGVRGRDGGDLLLTKEEWEAVGFYHAFCFYKV